MVVRKLLITTSVVVTGLVLATLGGALTNTSQQIDVPAVKGATIDRSGVTQRFSDSLKIKTISDPGQFDGKTFKEFQVFLASSYPLVHERLDWEIVNEYSMLYTWRGKRADLKPIQLMAHHDVSPTEKDAARKWTHPPYSGAIADGYVWGKGSMHAKLNVITLLEATEWLLARGFQPERTIYLAFGHDDDVVGNQGARKIGELLASRGVELEYVLEEGGMILDGMVDGVSAPVAQVAIAEKGYLSIELCAKGEGGHSSLVPGITAIGRLATAVSRLESYEFPTHIEGASKIMLTSLAPEMPFSRRYILSNLWLFEPLVSRTFGSNPVTNALIRTTLATTVISGGVKDNQLPVQATATANIRIIPGETVSGVLRQIEGIIDDPGVEVSVKGHLAVDSQKMLSPVDSWGYQIIEKTIRELYPEVVVIPSQLTAITDSDNYKQLTNNLYRFQPSWISSPEDTRRLHGVDERTSIDNLVEFVQFYIQLIRNSTST